MRTCKVCECPLEGRSDKVFCSPNCTQLFYHRQRRRAAGKLCWPLRSTCKQCNSVFTQNKPFHIYCSKRCRWNAKYDRRIASGACGHCGVTLTSNAFKNCVECRAKRNAQNYKNKYGITESDYFRLFREQGEVCKICKRGQNNGVVMSKRRLAVDHSHKTGEIRGILCDWCNHNLGWFEKFQPAVLSHLGLGVNTLGV